MLNRLTALALVLMLSCGALAADFSEGGSSTPAAPKVSADQRKALEALLPGDGLHGGLKLQQPVRFYDESSLFEYINGQAEGFIAYEFLALASATYAAGDDSVVIDVYDMQKPINAFGLYSTFRSPANDFVALGEQGFKTSDGYMFWKGRMVVRVSADYADEAEMMKAAEAASRAVAPKIPENRDGLVVLSLLPEAGKIKNSEKYIRSAVLGQSFLSNGVVADYETSGGPARLFICEFADETAAHGAFEAYFKFASAHGKEIAAHGLDRFSADVKYYGRTDVFVVGNRLGGGVGLPQDAGPLIDEFRRQASAGRASDQPLLYQSAPEKS